MFNLNKLKETAQRIQNRDGNHVICERQTVREIFWPTLAKESKSVLTLILVRELK